MKREPRGFRYALDPLRKKSDWELQDLQHKLALINEQIAEVQQDVAAQEQLLSAASTDLSLQHMKSQVIFADKQRIAQAYISQVSLQLQATRKEINALETQRDETVAELHRLRKFVDGLDENRTDEMKDFVKITGKADGAATDDAWLRSMKWRAPQ